MNIVELIETGQAEKSKVAVTSQPARLAFFDNAFSRDPSDEVTLPELIGLIQSGRWAEEVDALRKALDAHGREKYDAAKRELPAVMLSGWAPTRRQDADAEDRKIQHSGLLQGDFDGKDHPHLSIAEIMDLVRADPHVVAAFISPSGQGVKAVLAAACDEARHRGAWEAAEAHFAAFGLKLDPATKDPGRLCFVSSDPDAWIRDEKSVTAFKPRPREARSSGGGGFDSADTTVADVREMLGFIAPRPVYDDWLRIASAVWSVLDETTGCAALNEWSPEEKQGEYARKWKKRLKDVRIGTLVWYAQAGGFDAAAAARRKRWAGRIRFADAGVEKAPVQKIEVAPDHADGEIRLTSYDRQGPESADNPQFVEWCLENEQRGDAELWQSIAKGQCLFDHFIGKWRYFDSGVWRVDTLTALEFEFQMLTGAAYGRLAAALTQDISSKPSDNPKTDPRRQIRKRAEERIRNLNRDQWKKGSLRIARTIPGLSAVASDFDRNPMLLALENGTIDFDACVFDSCPNPNDMLTHRAGVKFDPDAECPKFRAFMNRMLVDPEVVSFVMRAMAYSLTGSVDADTLFFCYGTGANGKSTFMLVFKMLLGELMTTIDVETLLTKKGDSASDYKKATLEGRRVALTDEMPEGRKLGESMVKALIGGDEIVARRPYEKPYTFAPTHKLWMVGNHKPVIEGTDPGIWRRICLIPWTQTIPEADRRPRAEVVAEFRQELPGILNWCLEAWCDYREIGGLIPPAAVREATAEYRHEQDRFGSFLEERTNRIPQSSVQVVKLLKAYLAWCEDNGERPTCNSSRLLVKRLKEGGLTVRAGKGNLSVVDGIALITVESLENSRGFSSDP